MTSSSKFTNSNLAHDANPAQLNAAAPELSIIIATRNEELNIAACLKRVIAVFPNAEILVVDGGADRTGDVVRSLTKQHGNIVYYHNAGDRGKGHAMRVGIAAARGRLVAQVDADMQFPPEELPRLLAPLISGQADLVMGSRFMSASVRKPGSQNFRRAFGNFLVSGFASVMSGQRMTDVMAGFKAWDKQVVSYPLTSDKYSYEVEIPIKALRRGFRVMDVAITTEARAAGESSVKVFREGMRTLLHIIKFRFERII